MKTKTFGILRAVSVLSALITALAAALSCLSVNAKALDQNSARQGVVAVVFALKNANMLLLDPETGSTVASQSLGDEVLLSHGSGFFVGKTGENPQYVVTNHHVVDDYINAGEGGEYFSVMDVYDGYYLAYYATSCEMRIYYDENDYDVAYIDCYGDQEKVDLAVLRLRNPTNKRTALQIGAVSEDNVGDTVYTVGYPGNADNTLSSASKYGINDSSVHKGSIVRIVMDDKGVERISVDATIQHGNSGGPLVNENGLVIGVNTNSFISVKNNSSIDIEQDYYSLSVNTLTDFLGKNNIPYEPASNKKSGVPVGLIVGIAGGAVVVVIIIVAVVLSGKKGSITPAPAPAHSAAPVQSVPPVQAAAPQSTTNALIVCEKGVLAGRTFPLGNGVVIGRDPKRCGVCFPVDAKGVSGAHCEIRKTANGFEILDLGSSYGTTLGSGQKLTPNNPVFIPNGTYFMVGSAEQLFQIKY